MLGSWLFVQFVVLIAVYSVESIAYSTKDCYHLCFLLFGITISKSGAVFSIPVVVSGVVNTINDANMLNRVTGLNFLIMR